MRASPLAYGAASALSLFALTACPQTDETTTGGGGGDGPAEPDADATDGGEGLPRDPRVSPLEPTAEDEDAPAPVDPSEPDAPAEPADPPPRPSRGGSGAPSDPDEPTLGDLTPATPGDASAPLRPDGSELPWPSAPLMEGVAVEKNLDGVTLLLPPVSGAVDYRAFVLDDDVTLELEGSAERVLGASVFCAGQVQRNAPAQSAPTPARRIDVAGVSGSARVVVEALDRACPFVGVRGKVHKDIAVTNYALSAAEKEPFSIYTEAEIRARYGSLIVNGHQKGASLGAPAPDVAPGVLARTTLNIAPSPAAPPVSDFFSTFDDDADQPVLVGELETHGRVPFPGELYENADFTFTTYAQEHTQFFIDRGQLHVLLADLEQDVFGSAVTWPKKAARMSDDKYLHVTYEVPTNATQRRYWWLTLCGAATAGQTLDDNGRLMGDIVQTPFFYQSDGKNPSIEKWSCLQLFPRDGLADPLAPTNTRPESDLRVMINVADAGERDSVRNVSPEQYANSYSAPGWYRQMNESGELVAPMLDDELFVSQQTRYDVWVRRDRVIVFVNGEQRLCNDFPQTPLTMAEAAIGFGQVLYHSAAERVELSRPFNDRTGQRYYLENTPYLDARVWDNVGFDDERPAPAGFDPSRCYVHEG